MTTIKRIDGLVLAEREGSICEAIEALIKKGADLSRANLSGANLYFNNKKIEIIKNHCK